MRDLDSSVAGSPPGVAGLTRAGLAELGRQLHVLRISLDGAELSTDQLADMERLAVAEIAADRGLARTVDAQLAAVGSWTITAATAADARLVVAAISERLRRTRTPRTPAV